MTRFVTIHYPIPEAELAVLKSKNPTHGEFLEKRYRASRTIPETAILSILRTGDEYTLVTTQGSKYPLTKEGCDTLLGVLATVELESAPKNN